MKRDIREQWLEELRSDRHKKGRYGLKDCDGYVSPGGILCDLAVAAGVIDPPKDLTKKTGRDAPMFFGWTYEGEGVGIPESVAKWADISYRAVWRLDYKSDCGLSFDEVADLIEKEF